MITPPQLFPCLGFQTLGMCAYNPTQPSSIYFSIGDALGVLAFTFAVQQFLKPSYTFRLRGYGLRISYFLASIFIGALCAMVALVTANISSSRTTPFGYPVLWELLGGCIIFLAYALVAFISFTPVKIYSWNLISVVRAGGRLLSGATEDDRVGLADDIFRPHNIEILILHASAWDDAEYHAIRVEMERLRSIGAPQSIRGRVIPSAFYQFAHRRKLEKATYAATFLQMISDHDFCAVAVRRHPWPVADLLRHMSEKQLYAQAAKILVQQLAAQAIVQDESLLSKEIMLGGFSHASLLSGSLFADIFILRNYEPMFGLSFKIPENPSEQFCQRLNSAAKMMLDTAIANQDFWPQGYMQQVGAVYESLVGKITYARYDKKIVVPTARIFIGIDSLMRTLQKALPVLKWQTWNGLFIVNPNEFRTDLVEVIASMVYDSFEGISNGFEGFEDVSWAHAISTFNHIYPFGQNGSVGLDPLQQQLALKLIDKVKENMTGYYPAVTRLLLAVIGPYNNNAMVLNGSGFALLRDAFYKQIQKLPELHARKPDKVGDFLPPNVSYNPIENSLNHRYRVGAISVTKLSELQLADIDFCSSEYWLKPDVQLEPSP